MTHARICFVYAHKNKNVKYSEISPNSINTEFLLPFFRVVPMIPFYDKCYTSQLAYMLSPSNAVLLINQNVFVYFGRRKLQLLF